MIRACSPPRSLTLAIGLFVACSVGSAPAAAQDLLRPAGCPSATEAANFVSQKELYRLNARMERFGPRTTGSPNHKRFVSWLERRVGRLRGMRTESTTYRFDRWSDTRSSLRLVDGPRLRIPSVIPYSEPTRRRGITAPLVHVPTGDAIGDHDVRGKLVVRDFPAGSVPNAAFAALQWWEYDPDLSLTKDVADNYERGWLNEQADPDLQAAQDAGAAGLVFVHEMPYEQVVGYYGPYHGIRWKIPGLWVGVDEGEALKRAAAAGRSATLKLSAQERRDSTRMITATLPGVSDERLVVTSHTDGMNAVWDNGPIAMVAIAEHYASLPLRCRPRTLQFVFTTGHLFMGLDCPSGTRDGSAVCAAEQHDKDYNEGSVAAVMAVEHLGARNFEAVPRPEGRPGRMIVPSGLNEPNSFFIGESPALSEAVLNAVVRRNLIRSIALRGADLPGPHVPMHHSFGGEGGAPHSHLIPTVAFVTGSWALFGTAFEIDELLDPELLHQQTLVFTDALHNMETIPREVLAGGYLPQRTARNVLCTTALASIGLASCERAATESTDAYWAKTVGKLQRIH